MDHDGFAHSTFGNIPLGTINAAEYEPLHPPILTKLIPNVGDYQGGNSILLRGKNLSNLQSLTVGSTLVDFDLLTDTTVSIEIPGLDPNYLGPGGHVPVDVTASSPEGVFTLVDGYIYSGVPISSIGVRYCDPMPQNSTGESSTIYATGTPAVAANNLTMHAFNLPQNQFGYLLNSRGQGFIPNPAGSFGNLCLGGGMQVGRHNGPSEIRFSGDAGTFELLLDNTSLPNGPNPATVQVGENWNFQFWHRDLVNNQSVSNFTDALSITFE